MCSFVLVFSKPFSKMNPGRGAIVSYFILQWEDQISFFCGKKDKSFEEQTIRRVQATGVRRHGCGNDRGIELEKILKRVHRNRCIQCHGTVCDLAQLARAGSANILPTHLPSLLPVAIMAAISASLFGGLWDLDSYCPFLGQVAAGWGVVTRPQDASWVPVSAC